MIQENRHFILLIVLLVGSISFSEAQNIELIGGTSFGRYWNTQKPEGHYTERMGGFVPGYRIGIEASDIRILDSILTIRGGFLYEEYGGSFNVGDGGLGSHTNDSGSVTQKHFGITLFPFQWKPIPNLYLSFGLQQNFLLDYNAVGMRDSWAGMDTTMVTQHTPLNEMTNLARKTNTSLLIQFSYAFYWKKLVVEPRICTVLGLSNELPAVVASMHHFRVLPSIGIGYSLSKK